MPIQTSIRTLQALLRPVLAVREEGECLLNVTPESIRLRARSEGCGAYIDHSIPLTAPELSATDVSGRHWVRFKNLIPLFNTCSGSEVTIRIPEETPDATFMFHSGNFTYRYPPISETTAHRVFDSLPTEPTTELSIQNEVFYRAITAANLLGTVLQVHFNHDTSHIEFSAEDDMSGDSFLYTHPVEQIRSIQPQVTELTISIDPLRDIIPYVPATTTVSLELTPHRLMYRAEHPVTSANLTVYIAKNMQAIDG